MPETLDENSWKLLLGRIKSGRCTPFIGAGACYGVLPLGREIARAWAADWGYPLKDNEDLARVAQYRAVMADPMTPKEEICERFAKVAPPDFDDPKQAHRVLADLPFPVYLTSNYDDFMMKALAARKRNAVREICQWNDALEDTPSVFKSAVGFEPTAANSVVYHLHGHIDIPESLVLTEDDYLDFMVRVAQDPNLLPARIQKSMSGASLLFVGYRLADWNFRVLFRSLVTYMQLSTQRAHVSVQLKPAADDVAAERQQQAINYLKRSFDRSLINIYWGTSQEFAAELRERWDGYADAD
ncbi:MAG TPA: SIR2 family protein [Thermomicrobiales bacterium]|jgi:hypothetical protein